MSLTKIPVGYEFLAIDVKDISYVRLQRDYPPEVSPAGYLFIVFKSGFQVDLEMPYEDAVVLFGEWLNA
jgi:hypothetical protein